MDTDKQPENSIETTINRLLKEKKVYQKELCKYLGISESGIKKMHRESSYKLSTLQKIAEFLKVNLIEIIQSKVTVDNTINHPILKVEDPNENYIKQENKSELTDKDVMELELLRELITVYRKSNASYEKDIEELKKDIEALKPKKTAKR